MVIPAQDVGDAHHVIVHGNRKIIGREAVAFADDVVSADAAGFECDRPFDDIVKCVGVFDRHTETDDRRDALRFFFSLLGRSQVCAFAAVMRHFAACSLVFAFRFQFILGAIALVGTVGKQQLIDQRIVDMLSFGLTVRSEFAWFVRTFVPVHP